MNFTDLKILAKHLKELGFSSKSHLDNKQWYYFLHIPKTGGTSLRYALFDQFKAHQIYPNNVDYYLKNKGRYLYNKEFRENPYRFLTPKVKLLMGHFRMYPIDMLQSTPLSFALFRNPIDRIISALNYHSEKGRSYQDLELDSVIKKARGIETNLLAKHLGLIPKKKNFNEVFENLEKINVIGITEHFDKSVELLNKSFNWNLSDKYYLNKSNTNLELNNKIVEELKSVCQLDLRIYNKALEIFKSQCQSKTISL